jgi:hypothetical protein
MELRPNPHNQLMYINSIALANYAETAYMWLMRKERKMLMFQCIDGYCYTASDCSGIVCKMRIYARHPSGSVQEFMRAFAHSPMISKLDAVIRTDTADNFVADLEHIGIFKRVDLKIR